MKKIFYLTFICLALLHYGAAYSQSSLEFPQRFRLEKEIDFFGNGKLKVAEVIVRAYKNKSYELKLRVVDPYDGGDFQELLVPYYYEYKTSLFRIDKYARERYDDPVKDFESVKLFASSMLNGFVRSLDNVEELAKRDEYYELMCYLPVSMEYFKAFTARNIPVYSHQVGEEEYIYIAWIPELGQAISIAWC